MCRINPKVDIAFKKLGLLIIDEEQKFGVKQKEHFKNDFSSNTEATPYVLIISYSKLAIYMKKAYVWYE